MPTEEEIMRRRRFITNTLTTAGLTAAPGIILSAARLDPHDPVGTITRKLTHLEETTTHRATQFPTTPAIDQLPTLLRDYIHGRDIASEATGHHHTRALSALAYLTGLYAANLIDHHDAHEWFTLALDYAETAGDDEAAGWISARATFLAWHRRDTTAIIKHGTHAALTSPHGQLGSTLGNALAASACARAGQRDIALKMLHTAEKATDKAANENLTAYTFPTFRFARFASDVYTHLGELRRAREYQDYALTRYPSGAITDRTYLALDRAECMAREGDTRDAAYHAIDAMVSLPPERRLPFLLRRAEEVRDRCGDPSQIAVQSFTDLLTRMRDNDTA